MYESEYYKYTRLIVIVNVFLFFLIKILFNIFEPELMAKIFFLTPMHLAQNFAVWTLLTSIFTHTIFFFHLVPNMLSLYFIGRFVEPLIGKKRFLLVYLLSGILAGAIHVAYSFATQSNLNVPSMGASGAILGLVGLLAAMMPKSKVLLFFVIPIPLWALGALLVALVLFNPQAGGFMVGHVAHLGGFLVGYLYGLYLVKKFPEKTQVIRRVYS